MIKFWKFSFDTFYIAPTPNTSFVTQLGYIARPTQLSSTNTTTWISTNAPEALLYAVLIQAHSYTKGPLDMLQYFEKSYKEAIQGLGIEQQGRRRRDEYRDGMLRVKIKSESPGPWAKHLILSFYNDLHQGKFIKCLKPENV